jgi:hypothetical protein
MHSVNIWAILNEYHYIFAEISEWLNASSCFISMSIAQKGFIVTFPYMHVMCLDQIHPLYYFLILLSSISPIKKINGFHCSIFVLEYKVLQLYSHSIALSPSLFPLLFPQNILPFIFMSPFFHLCLDSACEREHVVLVVLLLAYFS